MLQRLTERINIPISTFRQYSGGTRQPDSEKYTIRCVLQYDRATILDLIVTNLLVSSCYLADLHTVSMSGFASAITMPNVLA